MNNEIGNDSYGSVTLSFCNRTVNHEVSADLTLPDYLPEMKRILSVTERIMPPARYVSASGVECNGVIDYGILYVGSDGELHSASLSSEYELNASSDTDMGLDMTEGGGASVTTVCDGTFARLLAPRRINLKSRLRSHVRAYCGADIAENAYGDVDGESIQRLFKETENACVLSGSSDVIDVSDEISGLGDDVRVASADAGVFVSDIRCKEDLVTASGDVILELLICRDGESPRKTVRKIRFDGETDISGVDSDCLCRVNGSVSDIAVSVEEGRISCVVSVVLNCFAVKNRILKYSADLYSTERECKVETLSLSLPLVICCSNGNFSQSERLPLADTEIPEGAEIIDAWSRTSFDECRYSDGKYLFSGQSRYFVLCRKDGEYSVCELELPAKYEADGKGGEPAVFDAIAESVGCRVRIDGDNLAIDGEIAVCYDIFGENNIKTVSEARFEDPFVRQKSRITVYYPSSEESAWDVAKKFHVRSDILSDEKNYYLF